MGFHPESGGICISENNGYHRFQGYPLVLFNTTLHHSQTYREEVITMASLSTIYFYIILKPQIQK